ncbi:MAG: hypothetical protein R3330_01575, partial [Saprospiraceae bacterium]|nr:hypothetical protein [Saprospiraceae bacterium]
EAVEQARNSGLKVSSMHLRVMFPMVTGLTEIFARFKKVVTVEINYSDPAGDPMIAEENRRYAQLALLLRARTRCNVDCFSNVYGQPMSPGKVLQMIKRELSELHN